MNARLTIRLAGFAGGLFAACAVALAAYAMHATLEAACARATDHRRAFAFGHGIALAALARHGAHWLGAVSLLALLAGVLLFAGSLVGAALAHTAHDIRAARRHAHDRGLVVVRRT